MTAANFAGILHSTSGFQKAAMLEAMQNAGMPWLIRSRLIGLLFLLFFTPHVAAQTDGQQIRSMCMTDAAACDFYLSGLADGIIGAQKYLEILGGNRIMCIPPSAQYDTGVAVIKSYMARNPKIWTEDPATIGFLAFMDAWPCQ